MKIMQVGPNSPHVFNYLDALLAAGIDTRWISDEKNMHFPETQLGVLDFKSFNPQKIARAKKEFIAYIHAYKPDVLHVHQINRMAFWTVRVAKKMNIPVVATAWGSDVLLMPQKNRLFYFLVKSTIKQAQVVTADAQLMIDAMQKMVPSNTKYHWLQYGIQPVIAVTKKQIIYSNRLHNPLYRIDRIIELFAQFVMKHPDWILRIAGNGSETHRLKMLVQNAGIENAVEFVGWLNYEANKNNYAEAMVYISIPQSDGTSVSLLEAMSAGCIPIVSNIPANKEWIKDGKNGLLYTEENQQNPLDLLSELDVSNLQRMNMKLIQEKATREASISQFTKIYRTLAHELD